MEEAARDPLTWHPLLEAAFAALQRAGVRYSLLRRPANPVRPDGDLDLLVESSDGERMRSALRGLGLVRLPPGRAGGEQMFLAYHAATDCWIRLHVVSELSFGPRRRFRTATGSTCLARRRRIGNLAELAVEDEFWTTLLHALLEKEGIAARHRDRLRDYALRTEPGGPLREIIESVCPAGWGTARIVDCVRQGCWGELEALAPDLATTWRRRTPLSSRLADLLEAGLRLPVRLLNQWRRRGVSVALLGPDGAGKSTLAAGLSRSFFGPTRTIYMGFGVSGGAARPSLLARLGVPGLGAPGRLLVLWGRFLLAWYHQARGRLVIFDRYTYDGLAPPPGRRGRLRRLSSWVKSQACPPPGLVLLLDVPGRVMYERKGDLDPDTLEYQRQRFLALRRHMPRLQVLDATHAEEALRIEATKYLWRLYVLRWDEAAAHSDR
jgi:thymidylate kinase